jgi:hypothetical protein
MNRSQIARGMHLSRGSTSNPFHSDVELSHQVLCPPPANTQYGTKHHNPPPAKKYTSAIMPGLNKTYTCCITLCHSTNQPADCWLLQPASSTATEQQPAVHHRVWQLHESLTACCCMVITCCMQLYVMDGQLCHVITSTCCMNMCHRSNQPQCWLNWAALPDSAHT